MSWYSTPRPTTRPYDPGGAEAPLYGKAALKPRLTTPAGLKAPPYGDGGLLLRGGGRPEQNPQHAAQRFSRAPEQLIAHRKRGQILGTHRHFTKPADRRLQRAGHRRRRQVAERALLVVGYDRGPLVCRREEGLDLPQRHIARQLHRDRLAVAAHRADTYAQAVDRDRAVGPAENLVAFGLRLRLFLALAVAEILRDPRQQAAGEREAEVLRRELPAPHRRRHRPIDVQDARVLIGQQRGDRRVRDAHLRRELAHVLGAGARGGLVRHCRRPLDQSFAEEAGHRHQHQADRAVAADVVADALVQCAIDDLPVHRVEDDYRVVRQPQRTGRVNPVAFPAGRTQLRVDIVGVLAALARNEDVHRRQFRDRLGILHRRRTFADVRSRGARLG